MNLNVVADFVKVVEAGSFVGAARAAGVSKSTIARHVDDLEEHLGVRLLQRSTRQSELTEAGRAFYERARQIVTDLEDAVAGVSAQQREPRGKLRFSTSVLLGETCAGLWCSEYMHKHPQVEIDMFLTARKVDLLADGFDLVVRVGELESSSHIVRRLAPAPSYICASPGYLEAHDPPRAAMDLRERQCIVYSSTRAPAPWVLSNAKGDSVSVAVHGTLVTNSYPVVLDACLAGCGIAEMPALVCADAIRAGRLVRLLPEWSKSGLWLHALYPSRQHLPATVRTFLDFISDKLTPPPWEL